MNQDNLPPSTGISDRRRHRRRPSKVRVRLAIDSTEIRGEVENVSRSGLLFFSEGSIGVTLDIEENGQVTKRTGRVVRAQRIRGNSFGWAIEFDS